MEGRGKRLTACLSLKMFCLTSIRTHLLKFEPSIYIPEENLGIGFEQDLVMTENDLINLMKEIPIEIEDVEAFMNM